MTWVIVGLGNPGSEYESTRHNAGRMAVMHFAKQNGVEEWKEDKKANATVAKVGTTICLLPNTFMNKSGSAVLKYVKPARREGGSAKAAEKMIVVYDDLDLPLGVMKMSFDRGSGGHKGLESVMRAVKTKKFTRIRIGVSPATAKGVAKKPHGEGAVLKFILQKFKPSELDDLKKIFKRTSEAITATINQGPMMAMNEFNR
ncbi:aminoacyl-tRNA hydrolase [Candidatus Kaiserbacteria bacterium]|nr:aminoacyl-tRNA hydrolase [Candidatus Kaiserbacteria bacterium]